MNPSFHSLTHGTAGLALAYAGVLIAVLIALYRRAGLQRLLLAPLIAVPALVVAAILQSVLAAFLGSGSLLRFIVGALILAASGWLAGLWFARRPGTGPRYQRGAVVAGAQARGSGAGSWLHKGLGSLRPSGHLTLAGIPVPPEDETKHFKLIGTTGTGKSTGIAELLSAALARGDRAIIADPDGGYRRRFFNALRGDVILNPYDSESRRWDLFGEIHNDYDVDQLARSLIPDAGEDRTWSEYGRTFFTAVTQQLIQYKKADAAELYYMLTVAPAAELRLLLQGTPAGPFLEEGNERMFGSIRSVTSSAVRALNLISRQQGSPLSVRQWVRRGPGVGGVLFLPYSAGQIAALASTISAWMRLGIFEAMDQPEGDQRLWFVVDELDALGSIDGLKDALARLRKFGGRCILGFQSISQVSRTYGRGTADTIVENCGNTLILRCSAAEQGGTSEFASKLIGQRDMLHALRSRTRQPLQVMSSTTTTTQLRTEYAVMASEIERLPDLTGYLKLASVPDWRTVTLTRRDDTPRATGPVPDIGDPAQS